MMTDHSKSQEKLVMKEGLFLLRDALTRAWGFKKVTTKGDWFLVKAVFDERCTYKGMRFQRSDHQRGVVCGEGSLWWEVHLKDLKFFFWWRQPLMRGALTRAWCVKFITKGAWFLVKTVFDERCSYKGIMFWRWSPKGNGLWWRQCLMRGALTSHEVSKKVITKEEWFLVKAAFDERWSYKGLVFQRSDRQRRVVCGEDRLWWEVHLLGLEVCLFVLVKAAFDERYTYKDMMF